MVFAIAKSPFVRIFHIYWSIDIFKCAHTHTLTLIHNTNSLELFLLNDIYKAKTRERGGKSTYKKQFHRSGGIQTPNGWMCVFFIRNNRKRFLSSTTIYRLKLCNQCNSIGINAKWAMQIWWWRFVIETSNTIYRFWVVTFRAMIIWIPSAVVSSQRGLHW